MTFELKDLLAWGGAIVTIVAQFFHLKGRISVIEARQKDLREDHKDLREDIKASFDKIDQKLDKIDQKLDGKADKP